LIEILEIVREKVRGDIGNYLGNVAIVEPGGARFPGLFRAPNLDILRKIADRGLAMPRDSFVFF
jgi:hypothetical protein